MPLCGPAAVQREAFVGAGYALGDALRRGVGGRGRSSRPRRASRRRRRGRSRPPCARRLGRRGTTAGDLVDRPQPDEAEIDFLLDTLGAVLHVPLDRGDILGTFSGLRPLLRAVRGSGQGEADTADLSRRHAVVEGDDGVLSVVGGKLTTYRRMAQDGVDAAVRRRGLPTARPSATADLPLVGAWPRHRSGEIRAPERLVRRYGAEAPFVARLDRDAGSTGAERGVTAAELEWGVRVEGALTVADLLERRTRLGLVAADAEASAPAAFAAFERAGVAPLAD